MTRRNKSGVLLMKTAPGLCRKAHCHGAKGGVYRRRHPPRFGS